MFRPLKGASWHCLGDTGDYGESLKAAIVILKLRTEHALTVTCQTEMSRNHSALACGAQCCLQVAKPMQSHQGIPSFERFVHLVPRRCGCASLPPCQHSRTTCSHNPSYQPANFLYLSGRCTLGLWWSIVLSIFRKGWQPLQGMFRSSHAYVALVLVSDWQPGAPPLPDPSHSLAPGPERQ